MFETHIQCLPYPYFLSVFIGKKEWCTKKHNAHYNTSDKNKVYFDGGDGVTYTMSSEDGQNFAVSILVNSEVSKSCLNMIVYHECFHAAHVILDSVGVKLSIDSSEAFTYLIGHLAEKILKEYGEYKTKQRKKKICKK